MRTSDRFSSPRSGHADYLGLLDRWVRDESRPALRDALLELRGCLANISSRPQQAVRTFLRLRPLLRRSSYWSQHRVRRLLEAKLQVEVTTPERCWKEALQLKWRTLARALHAVRRDVFEQGTADWDRIRVRLVPITD